MKINILQVNRVKIDSPMKNLLRNRIVMIKTGAIGDLMILWSEEGISSKRKSKRMLRIRKMEGRSLKT